jgi:hypothetical protein
VYRVYNCVYYCDTYLGGLKGGRARQGRGAHSGGGGGCVCVGIGGVEVGLGVVDQSHVDVESVAVVASRGPVLAGCRLGAGSGVGTVLRVAVGGGDGVGESKSQTDKTEDIYVCVLGCFRLCVCWGGVY